MRILSRQYVLQFLYKCSLLSGLNIKSLESTLLQFSDRQYSTELVFIYDKFIGGTNHCGSALT